MLHLCMLMSFVELQCYFTSVYLQRTSHQVYHLKIYVEESGSRFYCWVCGKKVCFWTLLLYITFPVAHDVCLCCRQILSASMKNADRNKVFLMLICCIFSYFTDSQFSEADLARSLLFTISNDVGQVASLYAMIHKLNKVSCPLFLLSVN